MVMASDDTDLWTSLCMINRQTISHLAASHGPHAHKQLYSGI